METTTAIEKELDSLREKDIAPIEENTVSVAKQLLANNAAEEVNLLLDLGISKELVNENRRIKRTNVRKQAEEKFGRKAYTAQEISDIGKRYFLKTEKSATFLGPIPSDLGSVLVRFCKEHNINTSFNVEKERFFIMAPPKMFKGYKTFTDHHVDFFDALKAEKDKFIATFNDPQIFYLDSTTNLFIHIKGWGSDFILGRRIIGYLRRTAVLPWLYFIGLNLLIAGILWSPFTLLHDSIFPMCGKNKEVGMEIILHVVFFVIAAVHSVLFLIAIFTESLRDKINSICSNSWYKDWVKH